MKRLLVVDKDPELLGGLESALRSAAGEWDVVCAMSGREGLDQVSRSAFDAVLATVAAPGIDGVALLDEVASSQPAAVRFLLAEAADSRLLLRAGATSHQHLVKPLKGDEIFARLAGTLALGDVLSDTTLQAIVSRLRAIPSPPAACLGILAELRKEEASVQKVGELVGRDAGMAAKLLQLVNSPLTGLRMPVTDPVHAVRLLGLETVRGLVVTAHVFEQMDPKTVTRFRLSRAWHHAVAAAGCAKLVIEMEGGAPQAVGEAFTAGLLHDVGKLVLARSLAEDYADVTEQAETEGVPAWMAERDMLGTTHAEVGAYLLSLWGLPQPIVQAVAWHHRPPVIPGAVFGLAAAVHVGNVIALQLHAADRAAVASTADEAYLELLQATERYSAWVRACAEAARLRNQADDRPPAAAQRRVAHRLGV